MKHTVTSDFFFHLASLIVSIILVHTFYVMVVWPNADALLAEQRARQQAAEMAEMPRSIYIVLKDYEQESEIILALWAVAIMGLKLHQTIEERRLLRHSLLEVTEGTSILPEDARKFARPLQALPADQREYLLPHALLTALQRFGSTRSIQDAAAAV